jgi:phosphatidylglycerol---prolipoprotein diacylglyceryl transferase
MHLAAATLALPFFKLGELNVGLPIQSFGILVAIGIVIGAYVLRRYAAWHGVADEHIRGLTGWIMVSGLLGAHVFDVIVYDWPRFAHDPLILFKSFGISSYGGFLGGAMGFAVYVTWKRLPGRLMADVATVGLLPAFSIGRIGCSVVHDHVGAAVQNVNAWYAVLAIDYPTDPKLFGSQVVQQLVAAHPGTGETIAAWNLGLLELLYLIPVNALILWLAFRASKRMPAGFLAVLLGMVYAPVRFFLEYLRPSTTDPRYLSLTFAQWCSILAFAVAVYVVSRLVRNGKPAETVARTSRRAQLAIRRGGTVG